MKRRVTYAKLHDINVVYPGIGSLGMSTLPPTNKLFRSFNMWREPGGDLELEVNGIESAIPAANIQFVAYASEGKDE